MRIENMLNEGGKGSNKYIVRNEAELAEWLGYNKGSSSGTEVDA